MIQLPPPGPGDNFYTICKNCGKITYTNKSSSRYCQLDENGKRKCNPTYNCRGKKPGYNPTITTCFGEQVNVDEIIQIFYNEYARGGNQWSDTIAAPLLVMCCRYHGPLPLGTEIVIVGGNAIRKVRIPNSTRTGYQFKPYTALTKDERDVRQNTIVKGFITTFYKKEEDHPLHEAKMTAEENDQLDRDYEDFCNRRDALNGEAD